MEQHGWSKTTEYRIWRGMFERCYNKNKERYPNYGGRGIVVCERWNDFRNFIADMGLRPSPQYSIDRINNDGNYEPGNCRWADAITQTNNARSNRMFTHNGETLSIAQWARRAGIARTTMVMRLIYLKWPIGKAITKKPEKIPPVPPTMITMCGETHSISDWARIKGILPGTANMRLQRGWSVEKAFNTPLRHWK